MDAVVAGPLLVIEAADQGVEGEGTGGVAGVAGASGVAAGGMAAPGGLAAGTIGVTGTCVARK